MKIRWKELLKTYQPPVQPDIPESIPLYLRECQNCHVNNDQLGVGVAGNGLPADTVEEMEPSHVGNDQLVFLNLTAKVCLGQLYNCTYTASA